MKSILALVLITALAANSALAQTPVTDGLPSNTQVDLAKWAMTQGGLLIALVVVLWSYRRDFFRKSDQLSGENLDLRYLLKENAATATATALAIAQNTNATNNLANVIQAMDRRKAES